MLVSIILPIYNAESFIEEALNSIFLQTYRNFELIAIDDGSTDSSLAILRRIVGNDKRVRVIARENLGLIQTLNQGIDMAKGSLVARMDADDICEPWRLECQVRFMGNNPSVVCVGGQIKLIDKCGREIMKMSMPLDHETIDAANFSSLSHGVVHPTAMIRLSALKMIGGYRSVFRHAEDIDLWLRLAEIGSLANLPIFLLKYRQHIESIGYKYRFEQKSSQWKAVKSAALRRGGDFKFPQPSSTEVEIKGISGATEEKWAWWALKDGNLSTARYYALRAAWKAPWRSSIWKLVLCCIRGR
jgi:glycosyltransferase involved in cell wall biosynthesis